MRKRRYGGFKRRSFKKRRFSKKRSVARIAKRVVMRNQKTDWIFWSSILRPDNQATGNGPEGVVFNALVQGTTRSTRLGNQIHARYLAINLSISDNSAVPVRLRHIVLRDTMPDGNPVLYDELFADGGTPNNWVYSLFNQDYARRYKILHDSLMTLQTLGGATDTAQIKFKKIRLRLNFKTQYLDSDEGDVSDILKNTLAYIVCTDQGPANRPIVGLQAIFTYKNA